ncbi:hypothetical protein CGRA01v4_09159 [Colletotrichum graminicola]|nr:hypothetical protein CGRA01v4_09159 [Colletotrichum graminicola]
MASNLGALNGVKPASQHRPPPRRAPRPLRHFGSGGGTCGSLGGSEEEGRGAVSAGKSVAAGPRCSRYARFSVSVGFGGGGGGEEGDSLP